MSHQSARQAARRTALDAQAVLRKERAPERRLESLAVAVLTALGERDAITWPGRVTKCSPAGLGDVIASAIRILGNASTELVRRKIVPKQP